MPRLNWEVPMMNASISATILWVKGVVFQAAAPNQ